MFFSPLFEVGTTALILLKFDVDIVTVSLLQVYVAVVPSNNTVMWLSSLKTVLLVQYCVVPVGLGIRPCRPALVNCPAHIPLSESAPSLR